MRSEVGVPRLARDVLTSRKGTASLHPLTHPVIGGTPDAKHVLRRTPEPHDADVDAPIYQADEWLLENVENHAAMVALYFMYYNFARVHQTLRVTPAMEAGIADHVWSIEEIVGLAI